MAQVAPNTLQMTLPAWQGGLTLESFVDTTADQQTALRRRLRDVRLPPEDVCFLGLLSSPVYVLALTEGWCGDSLMNLPILARIVEAAPGMELRVFVRCQCPALSVAYATRGIYTLPVFTFFDADFHEIGTWVERPRAAHHQLARWRAAHPDFDQLRIAPGLTHDDRHVRLRPLTASLFPAMEQWYGEGLQAATVAEITVLLASVMV